MAFIGNKSSNRSDSVVTLIAIFSILLAGGISIATITTDRNVDNAAVIDVYDSDPLTRAEQAAMAGIHAVKGHIECHGAVESGGLPDQYYANGARFQAVWDDLDMADSTVHIISTGYCRSDSGEEYSTQFESVIKVDLAAVHNQSILHDYYRANHGKRPISDNN